MPSRIRTLLYLATLLLLYNWLVGLPTLLTTPFGLLGSNEGKQNARGPSQVVSDPRLASSGYDLSQPWTKRVVAVGDLHGDLAHAMRVFRAAKLVDHRGYWSGGDTTLVQTGDIVDRGKDTIALYRQMDSLRDQATRAGGRVISLLGNHEFMNVLGDWRYVTKDDIATFHGEHNRRRAFSQGWIGQTFRANYSVAARVPYAPTTGIARLDEQLSSSSLLAVHGGIHPTWADVERINRIGASLLDKILESRVNLGSVGMPRDATQEERELYSSHGPLWYRGYALEDEERDGICDQAEAVLRMTRTNRMIMGHTPHFSNILSRCRSNIVVIDTGISSAYGGVLSALEVVYTLTPSPAEAVRGSRKHGGVKQLIERETVRAVYEGRTDVISQRERTLEV